MCRDAARIQALEEPPELSGIVFPRPADRSISGLDCRWSLLGLTHDQRPPRTRLCRTPRPRCWPRCGPSRSTVAPPRCGRCGWPRTGSRCTPPPTPSDPEACFQSPKTLAGDGSPVIDEFCIPDVATMLGLTCDAVGSYLTDVIELRYRLPQLWAGVLAGDVTPWRARAIAQATVALTPEAAGFVDEQTAWCANRLTPAQLTRLVDHARARFMPEALAARSPTRPIGGTSPSPPTRSPTTAPSTSRPTWRSPTPSAWPRPWPPVPPGSRPSAPPTPSTDAGPPRWVTSPATSSPSASTNDDARRRRPAPRRRRGRRRPPGSCCTPTCPPTPSTTPTSRVVGRVPDRVRRAGRVPGPVRRPDPRLVRPRRRGAWS